MTFLSSFRSFVFLSLLLSAAGCGVLLGHDVQTETSSLVNTRAGQVEPWDKTFSAHGAGAFDAKALSATLEVRLARTDFCRRYTESEYLVRTREESALGEPGILLDAGVFVGGILGSLFVQSTPAKGGVILGAAIPLVADGVSVIADRPETSRTEFRKQAEPGPGTDAGGIFDCSVMSESWAELRFENQVSDTVDGVYRFKLGEAELMALGNTEGVTVPLLITPKHVAQVLRNPVELRLTVELGPDYEEYARFRDEARRYGTVLRMAQFIARYPSSIYNDGFRSAFMMMVPASVDTEALQAIAGMPALDAELRQAAHGRFTELRLERLVADIEANLLAALRVEKEEKTFRKNGFVEQSRESAAELSRLLAAICHQRDELAARDVKTISQRNGELKTHLSSQLGAGELNMVMRWLQGCTSPLPERP